MYTTMLGIARDRIECNKYITILETACDNYMKEMILLEDAEENVENKEAQEQKDNKLKAFLNIAKNVANNLHRIIMSMIRKIGDFIQRLIDKFKTDKFVCVETFTCNSDILTGAAATKACNIVSKIKKGTITEEDVAYLEGFVNNDTPTKIEEGTQLNARSLLNAYRKAQEKIEEASRIDNDESTTSIDQNKVDLINRSKAIIPTVMNKVTQLTGYLGNEKYFKPLIGAKKEDNENKDMNESIELDSIITPKKPEMEEIKDLLNDDKEALAIILDDEGSERIINEFSIID